MIHSILLVALSLLLAACQSPNPGKAPKAAAADSGPTLSQHFNGDTVQTYDIQSGEFQQQPPFGARSDRDQ